MKNTLESLKYSTVIIFLLSFTIHFSYIVYYILNPEFPDVRVYNSDLEDIELPISFQICAHRKDTERWGTLHLKSRARQREKYFPK